MAVTIIDDDGPGEVTFAVAETRVRESQRVAVLEVERKRGVQGAVSVGWRTADGTALASRDYVPSRGRLTFAPGVTRAAIEVEIIDDGELRRRPRRAGRRRLARRDRPRGAVDCRESDRLL